MESEEIKKEKDTPVTSTQDTMFTDDDGKTKEKNSQEISLSLESDVSKKIIESAVSQSRQEFLATFGIFATLITFVSIQIQIFSKIEGVYNLLGISAFTLGGLLLFAIVLNNLSIKEISQASLISQIKRFGSNIGVLLCITFLLISVYFLFKEGQQNRYNSTSEIYFNYQ